MSRVNKRMDVEFEKIVSEKTHELIEWATNNICCTERYSQSEIALNVFIGSLVVYGFKFVEESHQEKFIQYIGLTLKDNFNANRENKNSSSE